MFKNAAVLVYPWLGLLLIQPLQNVLIKLHIFNYLLYVLHSIFDEF